MRKILTALVICFALLGLSSCNSCTMMSKNWESNTSFLKRRVYIYDSITGEVLVDRVCRCYAQTAENMTGDFSLIINENGEPKKYDFYGRNLQLVMGEQ